MITKISQPASPQLRIALIGCGAISNLFYSPILQTLAESDGLSIDCILDPDQNSLSTVGKIFPKAFQCEKLDQVNISHLDLAIIASPQRFHAQQAIKFLENGVHVLCEKPLASDLGEASAMLSAAKANQRILAVGLFRRFWPVTQYVYDLVAGRDLGSPVCFDWVEGGVFDWPAATPSFFQKVSSSGGVFADLGAHVQDILLLWFGPLTSYAYQDDAMGGLENNATMNFNFQSGETGRLRLSRDTPIPNKVWIEFERATVSFQPGTVGEVTLQLKHSDLSAKAILHPVRTYQQCFAEQVRNVCRAIRGQESLRVPGSEALPSMALIDQCYASRRLLDQPWLSPQEWSAAQELSF